MHLNLNDMALYLPLNSLILSLHYEMDILPLFKKKKNEENHNPLLKLRTAIK